MAGTAWNNYRYSSSVECIVNSIIRVYDIRKANISIFREAGVIDQATYEWLFNMEKINREIWIGNFLRSDPHLSKILSQGIIEAKRKFFELNNIEDKEVLEIDNDAVYILGNRPIKYQQVSEFVYFKDAEVYSSYYKVKDLKYLYYFNQMTRQESLIVKGLGAQSTALHEHFMLDFLKELFYTAQVDGVAMAITLLSNFHRMYISKSLDIGYYRTLNPTSRFRIVNFDQFGSFESDIANPMMMNLIDIDYNEKILRDFNRVLSIKYFKWYDD